MTLESTGLVFRTGRELHRCQHDDERFAVRGDDQLGRWALQPGNRHRWGGSFVVDCEPRVSQERSLHRQRDGDHDGFELGRRGCFSRRRWSTNPPKHQARVRVIHRPVKKRAKPGERTSRIVHSPGSGARELESGALHW